MNAQNKRALMVVSGYGSILAIQIDLIDRNDDTISLIEI
jgi:hypothetical protein